jgi:alkaline phosphatase D
VQVILLDGRYERDDYGDDPALTMLGAEQWAWLRDRLSEPATIRIIGSGIQVVNDYDPPTGDPWESWGDMPAERERLFALVRELGATGTILVSGDMHHAELSRLQDDAAGFGYATYDLTGSGLDQQETEEWPNPARIGTILNSDRKFGSITIEWSADPAIHLRLHDGASGSIHLEHVVHLSELAPPA